MNARIPSQTFVSAGGVTRPQDAGVRVNVAAEQSQKQYKAPNKAQDNYIPAPELLDNMIGRAVEAKNKGVYWDRGSIINLVL